MSWPINKLSTPAPSKKALEQPGFSLNIQHGHQQHSGYYGTNIGKKRYKEENEYFEDDEEDGPAAPPDSDLEYQPAPDSPGAKGSGNESDNDSVDPLDAYMAGIDEEVKEEQKKPSKEKKKENIRDDIEGEDVQEAFYRYMEENPMAGVYLEDDEIVEYDEDGNVIYHKNKVIDPLPPVDHHDIDYEKFSKNFLEEHSDVACLTEQQVNSLRSKLGIRVSGIQPPKPVSSFGHLGFDEKMMNAIIKAGYTTPTPIQAQGVPVALAGRDIIGIAKTGSGKTAAFLWPMILHILDQREQKPGDGPIGLICAPTRELSQQIYNEAKKFAKNYGLHVVCAYGGGSMYEQQKACAECPEIIVCTPGRLIDLVKKKSTNLQRVTFLVFDEADRMFDMGFEAQVRSIANHVRPDRQTLLFSATFKRKVERLARDILSDPIRVVQGDVGEANEDVTQHVLVFKQRDNKWPWLAQNLVQFTSTGAVLIFVTRKDNSEDLANKLKQIDVKAGLLHGDMSQGSRNEIITKFKKKEFPVLVATDVAARGLDIPSIKTVINYDVARDIDTHTHRVGRTGRAGEKGTAYTLLTAAKDIDFSAHLVRNLEGANQRVPEDVIELANKNLWFANTRFKQGKAKRLGGGGLGFKTRQRPGLGSSEGSSFGAGSSGKFISTNDYKPTNRLDTMRAHFKSQFQSNFISAATDIGKGPAPPPSRPEPAVPPPENKKRRKQRWDV
ncbi:ATP-dependent RNA helicase DDX42-like [Watersipora subatra]|uniref:ATP-dependent RNA helicase DDX42-like n=1 Tax=Watersipora subatra TaxID=2589382 RepID=UPI00355B74F4